MQHISLPVRFSGTSVLPFPLGGLGSLFRVRFLRENLLINGIPGECQLNTIGFLEISSLDQRSLVTSDQF
jgi:hypothetical protein